MLKQLIILTRLNASQNSTTLDYHPEEVAKTLFHQHHSFPVRSKYPTTNTLMKKQVLHIGRYEIDVRFPTNIDEVNATEVLY